ncbi:MAG TPA: glycogen debranching protein [Herpetosiphon sp.]|uniref:Glycogen debranching enzyme, putative n=1 Tax=Herpetosiphon aurantiacus (strain ATCC 23779 / DSM 785 / 114-95) TaxID=316274 RepID=A9B1M8_HERA2|nr:amylo-alpha-1,6-glucosidase [Herpetosiphon sp.]ABX03913.1 glycogen debranching enzyme, putative [Herpetosiphon aurantiacus DSM 785]HBW50270.1 glycogen debranching protein [Herpetosiphon sp.]
MFGREILGHPAAALRREWIVTNGAGAYAMGSLLANAPIRKYHGLLIAALEPPLGRTLLVGGLQASAEYGSETYELSSFEYSDGRLSAGHCNLETWQLDGAIPTARYALAEAVLSQRIWMEDGANTTYLLLTHERGNDPIKLELRPLLSERDHHDTTVETDWQPNFAALTNGVLMTTPAGTQLRMLSDHATWQTESATWVEDIYYREELERGYPDTARLLQAGRFSASLQPGQSLTLVFSTETEPSTDGLAALAREQARQAQLLEQARLLHKAPDFIKQLVYAADQFMVRRAVQLPDGSTWQGWSVIAGYPWFSDWGRDTMISLPGLLMATGRATLAADVLRTWSHFLSQGMLPNRFPDVGAEPEYNTVDATLWFFQALRTVYQATGDIQLVADLYPKLVEIIDWHERGTRYSIKVADDYLLTAGEPHIQLTWMDAKFEDWVVTPREGKAVEINALWYSALRTLGEFATLLGNDQDVERFRCAAERVATAYRRFWSAEHGYLYDVIDGPHGDDPVLRPNQLFAVSVAHSPLDDATAKAVVDSCARHLLTSYGLRSLAPHDPQYLGRYGGDLKTRDASYHQGITWGWLIGPFISAISKVYGVEQARSYLQPFADHLRDAGIGSVSEIFDGDAPITPRGCPWQAWSVAELLRCSVELNNR